MKRDIFHVKNSVGCVDLIYEKIRNSDIYAYTPYSSCVTHNKRLYYGLKGSENPGLEQGSKMEVFSTDSSIGKLELRVLRCDSLEPYKEHLLDVTKVKRSLKHILETDQYKLYDGGSFACIAFFNGRVIGYATFLDVMDIKKYNNPDLGDEYLKSDAGMVGINVHPDFRSKGIAKIIMSAVADRINTDKIVVYGADNEWINRILNGHNIPTRDTDGNIVPVHKSSKISRKN